MPRGRKRAQVEVYSNLRFMTMTGNVYRDAPIFDEAEFVNMLWHEMGDAGEKPDNGFDGAQVRSDAEVLAHMCSLATGQKADDLFNGRWQSHYPSQSEADFALLNFIQFSSGNRAQTRRIFEMAPSYRPRKYANRPDLLSHMVGRSFDNATPPPVQTSLMEQLKAVVDAAKVAPQGPGVAASNDGLLPIVFASDLAGKVVQRRSWHVPDMVPARTVTLFSGDGGTGKSLAALQLAFATAFGRPWLGSAVRHGPCLFVTAEDEFDDAHARLADISAGAGVSLASGRHPLAISSLAGCDALLAVPADRSGLLKPTDLCGALATYIDANRPVLVVLDTLSDLFGGEENNRSQVRQFVGMLRGLAIAFDTTVLLLSHPSVAGMSNGSGLSGSTAWNNSVRSRLYLQRVESEPTMRELTVMKSNYGAIGAQLRMEWRSGYFVEVGRAADANAHRMQAEASIDDLFLSLVAEFTERGQFVSQTPQSVHYAPKLFASNPRSQGFNKHQFGAAMVRLMSAGRIVETKAGPFASKQRDVIAVAGTSNSLPTPTSG